MPLHTIATAAAVIVLAGVSAAATSQSNSTPAAEDTKAVTFCSLIRNPERWDGKLVRLHAIWFQTFEWEWLYAYGSDSCNSRKNFIRPSLDCADDASCKPMQNFLNANLRGDPFDGSKTAALFTGRFHYRKEIRRGLGGSWYYTLDVARIDKIKRVRRRR